MGHFFFFGESHLCYPMCCLLQASYKGYDPYNTAGMYLKYTVLSQCNQKFTMVLVPYIRETVMQTDQRKESVDI